MQYNFVHQLVLWCYEASSPFYGSSFPYLVLSLISLWNLHMCSTSDINECTEGSHNCNQLCTNTQGSFQCSCRSGYTLNSDGRTCDGKWHFNDRKVTKVRLHTCIYLHFSQMSMSAISTMVDVLIIALILEDHSNVAVEVGTDWIVTTQPVLVSFSFTSKLNLYFVLSLTN